MVGVNVAVAADLALSVDTAESFEAEASIGSCTVDFVGSRATIHTNSVFVHHQPFIADAAFLCSIVSGGNWAGHAVSVLDEERYRTDVADTLEDTVS